MLLSLICSVAFALLSRCYQHPTSTLDSPDFRTRHEARRALEGCWLAYPALCRPAATPEGDRLRDELLSRLDWRSTVARWWLTRDDCELEANVDAVAALVPGTIRVRAGEKTYEILRGNVAGWMRSTPYLTGDPYNEIRAVLEALR